MKIDSKRVESIVKNSSNIVITSHKDIDLDSLGSMLGFYYLSLKYDKDTCILIEDKVFEFGVETAFLNIKKNSLNISIKKLSEISINKDTLLVIVDTNKKERIQNEKAFNKIKNRIVIDHHIKGKTNESDYLYYYVDDTESSGSEIITDIITDLNIYIPAYAASIMLSGIMVDTNRFYLKTTKNTFDVASKLKKLGATTNDIQYLFKQDFNNYKKIQDIIKESTFITENILISIANEVCDNEELAKAADTMLTFNYVEASFVIGHLSKEEIGISARSLGKIDVQKLMKELNGGGHKTDAATQIKGKNLSQVKDMLIDIIMK